MEFCFCKELCSAPTVKGAGAGSEAELRKLLSENGEDPSVLFALANFLTRGERAKEAVPLYQVAIKKSSESRPELRCNLGAALFEADRLDEALVELKQAVLERAGFALAYYYLAAVNIKKQDYISALEFIEPYTEDPELKGAGMLMVAQIYEILGRKDEAQGRFEKVLLLEPNHEFALSRFSMLGAQKGASLFAEGKLEAAFSLWASVYDRAGEVFSAGFGSGRVLDETIEVFQSKAGLEEAFSAFDRALKSGAEGAELYYPLCIRRYFSLGRIHELYENLETLEEQCLIWKKRASSESSYPYARYRLGVLYSYLGKIDEALGELHFAADHMPASKKRPLKIEQIIAFIRELGERVRASRENRLPSYSEDAWANAGFEDPFQIKAWKASGIDPKDAARWRLFAFSPTQSREWQRAGMTPENASAWFASGFTNALAVRQWQRGGFTPDEAALWREVFSGDAEKAVQFHKAGFPDAELACRWSKVFLFGWEACRWAELGFSPQEAAVFLAEGVKDPFLALEIRKRQQVLVEAGDGEVLSKD
jgi:tetratricopeptide (TPR) repeat protein